MLHDLSARLIDTVRQLTEAGELDWAELDSRPAYTFRREDLSVIVEVSGTHTIFSVLDRRGQELERIEEEELSDTSAPDGLDYETVVRDIYAAARRRALGTDAAIQRLLKSLDGDGAHPR